MASPGEEMKREPLQINWWTDADLRTLCADLADATGIDVWGQDDEFQLTRERLIADLKGLCNAIKEANIGPVLFEGDE